MISAIFTEPVKVIRTVKCGQYVDGYFVEAKTKDLDLLASVQPNDGEDLITEPEGKRVRDQIKIYCNTELKTISEDGLIKADVLLYNDNKYEIVRVSRYNRVLPHFKCIGLKVLADK